MRLVRSSRLDSLLAKYQSADFTYSELGATRDALPSGYHHMRLRRPVGRGDAEFRRAVDIVVGWDMHRGCGISAVATGPATEGRTVVMAIGRPFGLLVPCRVVYASDEPRRGGFGYGTLPDHPEIGEESFIVSMDADDEVWLEITAFSRAGSPLMKLAGPIARMLQRLALHAYVRSVRRQVSG
ncbi:MAG TPA: DUF1990 domain-containing protein [Mycobacteriales bacterium]|nr:DUF1990 domain-containing protein [Mycobacteriales bacterium]